jgi:hypothetical protein
VYKVEKQFYGKENNDLEAQSNSFLHLSSMNHINGLNSCCSIHVSRYIQKIASRK